MAVSKAKLFSLFQLSLLFVTCFSHDDHAVPPSSHQYKTPYYHKHEGPCPPPSKPQSQAPAAAPVSPPTHQTPPTKPPTHETRPGYIQGMVYCKSCKHLGVDTLNHAKPIAGARVSLKCKMDHGRFAKQIATTDKNGYFFMTVTKIVNHFGYPNCRVFLSTARRKSGCREHTDLNNGTTGAMLYPQETYVPLSYNMFTIGPFAFEPSKKFCKKHPHPHPAVLL